MIYQFGPVTDDSCRLCSGPLILVFKKIVLRCHLVSYFRCAHCGSLHTEEPYWLNEAYTGSADIDPGAAQRVLDCFAVTHIVARLFRCRRMLDYGGGAGLLCRLLRDIGHDAYSYDKYASQSYATGFTGSPKDDFDLMTAFEVVEHFADPIQDLDAIFEGKPRIVLVKTELYRGETEDWWYLAPNEGQHVFFYSRRAIDLIAARYGYHVLMCHSFILFARDAPSRLQKLVMQRLLIAKFVRLIRTVLISRPGLGAERDFAALSAARLPR